MEAYLVGIIIAAAVVVVIAVVILLISNSKTRAENKKMSARLDEYQRFQTGARIGSAPAPGQQPSIPQMSSVQPPMPQPPTPQVPLQNPMPTASYAPQPPVGTQHMPPQPPVGAQQPMPPQQAYAPPVAPQQPVPVQQVVPPQQVYPSFAPQQIAQQPFTPQTYAPKPAAKPSAESWVGRNIIGVIASILVFIGLVLLGFLATPYLDDTGKMATMFILSAAITIGGALLCKRQASHFSHIFLGCGIGALFISTMIAHLFFHALGDPVAYLLLIGWMVLGFFLLKWTQSILLSVIVHVGFVVSLCFALAGVSSQTLPLLLAYQIASAVVICVGNAIGGKKTYSFGLVISLCLTLLTSIVLWTRFGGSGSAFVQDIDPQVAAISFLVQFAAATVLYFLLFAEVRGKKEGGARAALAATNEVFWLAAVLADVGILTAKLWFVMRAFPGFYVDTTITYEAIVWAVGAMAVVVCVKLAVNAALSAKKESERGLLRCAIYSSAVFMGCVLFVNYVAVGIYRANFIQLPFFIVVGAVLLLVYRITSDDSYRRAALIFVWSDLALMFFDAFTSTTKAWLVAGSFLYLAALIALLVGLHRMGGNCQNVRREGVFRVVILIAGELCSYAIFEGADYQGLLFHKFEIWFVAVMILLVLFCLGGYDDSQMDGLELEDRFRMIPQRFMLGARGRAQKDVAGQPPATQMPAPGQPMSGYYQPPAAMMPRTTPGKGRFGWIRANELVIIFCSVFAIASDRSVSSPDIGYLVLVALGIVLLALRMLDVNRQSGGASQVFTGIALTCLGLAVASNISGGGGSGYLYSVIALVMAFICVLTGFMGGLRQLRLYGLVATILFVLKMVTYDTPGPISLTRVIAFIGGGAVCFGISALYTYAVKHFDGKSQ